MKLIFSNLDICIWNYSTFLFILYVKNSSFVSSKLDNLRLTSFV